MMRIIADKMIEDFGMSQIPFYNKLKGKPKDAKTFYWVNEKLTRAPKAVIT